MTQNNTTTLLIVIMLFLFMVSCWWIIIVFCCICTGSYFSRFRCTAYCYRVYRCRVNIWVILSTYWRGCLLSGWDGCWNSYTILSLVELLLYVKTAINWNNWLQWTNYKPVSFKMIWTNDNQFAICQTKYCNITEILLKVALNTINIYL